MQCPILQCNSKQKFLDRILIQITAKSIVSYPDPQLLEFFRENSSITYCVIPLTDRQMPFSNRTKSKRRKNKTHWQKSILL